MVMLADGMNVRRTEPPLVIPPGAPLPPAIASGQQRNLNGVGPSGGQGLWNIARQIHDGLDPQMKKTNSVESIYAKLKEDALRQGFVEGTDDGRIPRQNQEGKPSGRDLDLIYASDKFNIELNAPTGGAPASHPDSPNFVGPRLPNPALELTGANQGVSKEVQAGYDKAVKEGRGEEYLKLIQSDGFKELNDDQKKKALQLADKHGAGKVHTLVNDAGFRDLKGDRQHVPSEGGKDKRLAKDVILDRTLSDDRVWNAMYRAVTGDGFAPMDNAQRKGQCLAYMAMYAGRHKGYQSLPDDAAKDQALQNLWNNVLTRPGFWNSGNTLWFQPRAIQGWVDESGYSKPGVKLIGQDNFMGFYAEFTKD